MTWNLVDAAGPPARGKREYCVPLASETPIVQEELSFGMDWDRIESLAPPGLFSIEDNRDPVEPVLTIRVSPPSSGAFQPDGDLPHPAIRLHAVGRGRLKFEPVNSTTPARLILELTGIFRTILTKGLSTLVGASTLEAPWFDRWIEVKRIPKHVIYENVNEQKLDLLIASLTGPPPATGEPLASVHGLALPPGLTDTQRASFSSDFRGGRQFLHAFPGAYIAEAAADPADPTKRMLRLRCRYDDGDPMNTRELFHLLFGNDSEEALRHPLLRRMEQLAQLETVEPASRRMFLRPPLRTHARVMWEAAKATETDADKNAWASTEDLDMSVLVNDADDFNQDGYAGDAKCNLFGLDVCLRAGFRVPVWSVVTANFTGYQYVGATFLAQLGDRVGQAGKPAPIKANGKLWGRKWDAKINTVSSDYGQRAAFLNRMMHEQGRCFIIAKQRNGELRNGFTGLSGSAGHVAIIKQVNSKALEHNQTTIYSPQWLVHKTSDGQDRLLLQSIHVSAYQAYTSQAVGPDSSWFIALWPDLPAASHEEGKEDVDNMLALIELSPGKDPFTRVGLEDLNAKLG